MLFSVANSKGLFAVVFKPETTGEVGVKNALLETAIWTGIGMGTGVGTGTGVGMETGMGTGVGMETGMGTGVGTGEPMLIDSFFKGIPVSKEV